ncbi:MAG: hypothetical protein A2140_09825 [Candidatus Muproteobacteria bacterium RBG_16_62_13]|uniref:Uncharacterized protein n=1 Tax=Candidatus Muproteobacteria bacterium RBG_16_62_13 TaxID=1817756 RepID=A0A1F6SY04_9PROT|nr:MAG: hypothetical protein A2140_09825 [Candidatus Muproteobacteria bacterium RBG_16_62_13]
MPAGGRPERSDHPLAKAVFSSVYRSRGQRGWRLMACILLIAKHTLRGLVFSWPLYLMTAIGFYTEPPLNWLLWTLGVPGIAISIHILSRGIREGYRTRVADRLLNRANLFQFLRNSRPD